MQADNRPVDDPLALLLADPRQAGTRLVDTLWLRVLDVPAALAARTYPLTGSLAFTVHDAFSPPRLAPTCWRSATGRRAVRPPPSPPS